jgi:hypothetical protein
VLPQPRATVLFRDEHAVQAKLGKLVELFLGEAVVLVDLDRFWRDALVDQLAHGVANHQLLVGKRDQEVRGPVLHEGHNCSLSQRQS